MQVLRAALALVEQRLLARADRLVDLLALAGELGGELVESPNRPSSSSSWTSRRVELLVAVLRRVAQRERRRDGLAEQLELRAELGAALLRGELAVAALDVARARFDLAERVVMPSRIAVRSVASSISSDADDLAEQVDAGRRPCRAPRVRP